MRPGRHHPLLLAGGLLSAVALALLWALVAGDLPVTFTDVSAALSGGDGMGATVIRELRLPRAVAAFACGGLLATAGALMQVLLRNPLADPYILGISGGAAVAALGAITLGAATFWVDASAFAGALAAMLVVFGLAHGDGSWTQTRLLLTGVIVAAGCGAAVSLMLALAPDTRVMSMLFWMMGDASAAARPWPAVGVLVLALVVVMPFARDLNVLARGELTARALGVRVGHLRIALYVLASLLTATAVTLVGSVGFVGLIVPHLVRLVLGNDQRVLIPAAALAGGADAVLARCVVGRVPAGRRLAGGANGVPCGAAGDGAGAAAGVVSAVRGRVGAADAQPAHRAPGGGAGDGADAAGDPAGAQRRRGRGHGARCAGRLARPAGTADAGTADPGLGAGRPEGPGGLRRLVRLPEHAVRAGGVDQAFTATSV